MCAASSAQAAEEAQLRDAGLARVEGRQHVEGVVRGDQVAGGLTGQQTLRTQRDRPSSPRSLSISAQLGSAARDGDATAKTAASRAIFFMTLCLSFGKMGRRPEHTALGAGGGAVKIVRGEWPGKVPFAGKVLDCRRGPTNGRPRPLSCRLAARGATTRSRGATSALSRLRPAFLQPRAGHQSRELGIRRSRRHQRPIV